jgi:hypothetical protein
MIDDIVEMILKEIRARDRDISLVSAFTVTEEIFMKVHSATFKYVLEERRKIEDENKG